MKPLVISCSLNPQSRSALLAKHGFNTLKQQHSDAEWVDLREVDLPMCDGGPAYSHPSVSLLTELIRQADPILLAVPVYNYDANAAAKNLIELTGRAWTGKVVGFLCAAGGQGSYMSVMSLANSLMLDFRCLIVPRFVYATGDHFQKDEDQLVAGPIAHRTEELCEAALGLSQALSRVEPSPGFVR